MPVVLVAPFLLTLGADFQADDYWFVGDHSLAAVGRAFTGDWLTGAHDSGWFRPLTRLLFYFDDLVWGLAHPAGYHLTNCLLHFVNCCLFLRLLRVLDLLPRSTGGALLACIPFAWYPPFAATVAWVASRTDLLAVTGVLAALGVFHGAPGRTPRDAVLIAAATIFGSLSKESAYILPALLVASLPAAPGRSSAHYRRWAALFACAAATQAVVLLWRRHFLGGLGGYGGQFSFGGWRLVLRQVTDILGQSFAPTAGLDILRRWRAVGALMILAVAFLAATGRRPVFFAGLALWALSVVSMGSLPLLPVENARYLSLGGIGAALVVVSGLAGLDGPGLRRPARILAVVVPPWFLVAGIATASPWVAASHLCRQYADAITRASQGARGLIAIVADNMDPVSYEESPLHSRHGGKILPWDQAKWVMARRQPGIRFDWGLHADSLHDVTRVLRLNAPGSTPLVTGYDVVPKGEASAVTYEYLVAEITTTRPARPSCDALDGQKPSSIRSVQGSPPGAPTRHWFHLGFEQRDWKLNPGDPDAIVTREERIILGLKPRGWGQL